MRFKEKKVSLKWLKKTKYIKLKLSKKPKHSKIKQAPLGAQRRVKMSYKVRTKTEWKVSQLDSSGDVIDNEFFDKKQEALKCYNAQPSQMQLIKIKHTYADFGTGSDNFDQIDYDDELIYSK